MAANIRIPAPQPAVSGCGSEAEEGPEWFMQAIGTPPVRRHLDVDGARIHYRIWGDRERPGVVLVHGGGAHAGWWDHVGPQLTTHRVIALDLSGHGDSGRRAEYDLDGWASEVVAVIRTEQLEHPIVIGHSLGGWVSAIVGTAHVEAVSAIAVIDSPLNSQPPANEPMPQRQHASRVYASLPDAVARFVTLPEQSLMLPFVASHIARQSLKEVDGGWSWKFDPRIFGFRPPLLDLLPEVKCPAALFRPEHGVVTSEQADEMVALLEHRLPVVHIPAAGHAPMLDQPLALVTGLRTLLALWSPVPRCVVGSSS